MMCSAVCFTMFAYPDEWRDQSLFCNVGEELLTNLHVFERGNTDVVRMINVSKVNKKPSKDKSRLPKGPSIKDVRTQGKGVCLVRTVCGQGGCSSDADVRTFWCRNFGLFEVWCVRKDKVEGGWASANISRTRGRGSIFAILFGRCLWTAPKDIFLYIFKPLYRQGRRQKTSRDVGEQRGGATEKTRPKNSTISLPLLYQYHVWKSRGPRPLHPPLLTPMCTES